MLAVMRALLLAAVLAVVPSAAHAGLVLEGSVGTGVQLSSEVSTPTGTLSGRTPLNLMVAPGWGFAGIVRLQLGLVGNLGDVQNSKFDLELRPMVTVQPPLFPLYLRAILAVQNLTGNNGDVTVAYGGALGFRIGVLGAGAFIEAGVLPRNVKVLTSSGTGPLAPKDRFLWFAEGRVGAYYDF